MAKPKKPPLLGRCNLSRATIRGGQGAVQSEAGAPTKAGTRSQSSPRGRLSAMYPSVVASSRQLPFAETVPCLVRPRRRARSPRSRAPFSGNDLPGAIDFSAANAPSATAVSARGATRPARPGQPVDAG